MGFLHLYRHQKGISEASGKLQMLIKSPAGPETMLEAFAFVQTQKLH